MRCLTLHQPWAQLMVTRAPCQVCADIDRARPDLRKLAPHDDPSHRMIKGIETRSWRAPESLIGQRIAIHAAARPLAEKVTFGDIEFWPADPKGKIHPNHDVERPARIYRNDGRFLSAGLWRPLPLGAVVGSAVLTACVPMVDRWHGGGEAPCLTVERDRLIVVTPGAMPVWQDVSDQLPFGVFEPGRWAWIFTDAAPTTERCPTCLGLMRNRCPTCWGAGRCEPIPAKGAQRVWNLAAGTAPLEPPV